MAAIAGALAGISVALIVVWFQFRSRDKIARLFEEYDFETLKRKYNRLAVIEQVVAVIAVVGGILFGGFLGGRAVYHLVRNSVWLTPDTQMLLEMPTWMLLNVGAGTFTPIALAVACTFVWYAILGKNAKEYHAFTRMKSRVDYPAWYLAIGVVIFPAAVGVSSLLAADNYVRATDSGLVVNRFWTLGDESYAYRDITSIAYRCDSILRGKVNQPVPVYRLSFANGRTWESQGLLKEEGPFPVKKQAEFFAFVSQKSGRAIEVLNADAER